MIPALTAVAAQGVWPLAEGTAITQLLDSARLSDSTRLSDSAVAEVAIFYHTLLLALPDWASESGQGQGQPKAALANALVSGLAFGCNILQGLWRCAMVHALDFCPQCICTCKYMAFTGTSDQATSLLHRLAQISPAKGPLAASWGLWRCIVLSSSAFNACSRFACTACKDVAE